MSVSVFPGNEYARKLLESLRAKPKPTKFFAGIVAADDSAAAAFQRMKQRAAQSLGIDYRLYTAPADLSTDAMRRFVHRIAAHGTCGGVVVQLPLPAHINTQYVLNAIPRNKDVDVLGASAQEAFAAGWNRVLPPAVGATLAVLDHYHVDLAATQVAVVGLGRLVGKPLAVYLSAKAQWLSLFDKGFNRADLGVVDIVISGAGAPTVDPSKLKAGAGVIDFGYRVETSGMGTAPHGDLDASDAAALQHLAFYTPTPGGTGPVLIAKLLENFYILNEPR